ncbi:hypothetical protein SERLA73DRAFT_161200 [Serpula lacrymans var. lacrymans S7.3]|uniref:Uncharacterized protein n=1 Tax=Serpula lacrymans var. lacrymans (strain S7.3) TaxID=936435 RepID=F8PZU8_SERL3|nr:hypothetical protein SERLA73DRAFT_161200 [Serpula lacrymans var. lacrymans S7.3]
MTLHAVDAAFVWLLDGKRFPSSSVFGSRPLIGGTTVFFLNAEWLSLWSDESHPLQIIDQDIGENADLARPQPARLACAYHICRYEFASLQAGWDHSSPFCEEDKFLTKDESLQLSPHLIFGEEFILLTKWRQAVLAIHWVCLKQFQLVTKIKPSDLAGYKPKQGPQVFKGGKQEGLTSNLVIESESPSAAAKGFAFIDSNTLATNHFNLPLFNSVVDDENCYSMELVYGLCLLEQWSGLVVCGVHKPSSSITSTIVKLSNIRESLVTDEERRSLEEFHRALNNRDLHVAVPVNAATHPQPAHSDTETEYYEDSSAASSPISELEGLVLAVDDLAFEISQLRQYVALTRVRISSCSNLLLGIRSSIQRIVPKLPNLGSHQNKTEEKSTTYFPAESSSTDDPTPHPT